MISSREITRCVVAGMAGLALLCAPGFASAALDKNATYQQMLALAHQIQELKPQARANA
ncbi:MAG: hypothetical protein ABI609_07925 [Acidobacteriota bacterium]